MIHTFTLQDLVESVHRVNTALVDLSDHLDVHLAAIKMNLERHIVSHARLDTTAIKIQHISAHIDAQPAITVH